MSASIREQELANVLAGIDDGDGRRRDADRFAATAEADGLLDVAYATLDSPVGELTIAATPRGLVRVGLPNEGTERVLDRLARDVSPRILEAPRRLDGARRELDEYFEGRRRSFDLPLDWQLASRGFYSKVLHQLVRVPFGETATYGEMARRAGNARASRAAGTACGSNPIPVIVPCHRVVRSGGALGNYGGGVDMKRFLLELEGAV
jgi:methylated-DNA-[protein]-cysteine S-methyltransferase